MDLDLWQKKEYTGIKPGLSRIQKFLRSADDPHTKFRAIQIAGTNGKGSTAAFTAAILQQAGYRVGLYTSPHLLCLEERIRVNGIPISRNRLQALAQQNEKAAGRCSLTFFEFITGLAFLYFAQQRIDIAVLETGLGGRYDATNVIAHPLASIITDIDFDHEKLLGTKLSQIAWEKAGIIKTGCPVISGAERPGARAVIRKEAEKIKAPIIELSKDFRYKQAAIEWNRGRQSFQYHGLANRFSVTIPLLGQHQLKNCSLAIAAIETLRKQGYTVSPVHILRGAASARWPGRFDVRKRTVKGKSSTFILDGAHNPGAMERFTATWASSPWGKRKHSFIFGILQDKNYLSVISELAPLVKKVIVVPVRTPRSIPSAQLAKLWSNYIPQKNIFAARSFQDALRMLGREKTAGVTGSLYLVGEALEYFSSRGLL